MVERLKIKFLTVIWGARYIREFARVSLPSYLAAGNLPFVASETNLEIVILTSKDSRPEFDEEPIFARLQALCPVRYIFIDDLITTGVYGVTLTLAYARGIRDSGPEQTNTHFIFMNSDFVLADGSLMTLVDMLRDGHRCIMAPSLRACSEAALPLLADAADQVNGVLTMPPRPMVQLAFDTLHPTVIAKTVTQQFLTCATHNQVYWQVDGKTLLARYHLIFMLAIRPEVSMGPVNSYCDYGFVPELVPSGQFTILDDSDRFFMLELQSSAQELGFLRCGTSTPDEIARELSNWTTREHRRFAEVDVVFRSGDLPHGIAPARAELTAFMARLRRRMRQPVNHVDHFYWMSGVRAWTSLKYFDESDAVELPPELDVRPRVGNRVLELARWLLRWGYTSPLGRSELARRSLRWSYFLLFGPGNRTSAMPLVPVWNHLWLDSRLILNWLKSVKRRAHQKNLLVCDANNSMRHALSRLVPFEVCGLNSFFVIANNRRQNDVAAETRYDNLLVHVYRANVRQTREILESADALMKPDGTVAIYIEHANGELDSSNFSAELAQYVEEVLPADWIGHHLEASFAGGTAKRRLRRIQRFLLLNLWPLSIGRLPRLAAALAIWPIITALTAVNNLLHRNLSSICPPYCSSALMSLTRISTRSEVDNSRSRSIICSSAARPTVPAAACPLEPSPAIQNGG